MQSAGPLYDFDVDHGTRLVRATLRGQWELPDVERFHNARSALLTQTGWQSGAFNCLVDLRETGVQPMHVAAATRERLAQMPVVPRRVAIIVSSALAKLQANRISNDDNRHFFNDEPTALEWLTNDG